MTTEFVISFRKYKKHCQYKTEGVHGYTLRTSHACMKKLTMNWVMSKDPARFIECKEVNCPILQSCEIVIHDH